MQIIAKVLNQAAAKLQAVSKVVPSILKPVISAAATAIKTAANNCEQAVKASAAKQATASSTPKTTKKPNTAPKAKPKGEAPNEEEKKPVYMAPVIEAYKLIQGLPGNQQEILGEVNRQYGTGPFHISNSGLSRKVEGGTLVILSSRDSKQFLTHLQNAASSFTAASISSGTVATVSFATLNPIGVFGAFAEVPWQLVLL